MATVIINDTTPRVKYTANGSTTRFDFDFVCFQTADLVVYVGDTVAETGFTITHDPTTLKGYVTFDTAPAAGTGITLVRKMAYDQKVDFTQVALLKRDPLHNEFSRVFAMIQQINEAIGRSVTVDVFSDATPAELTGMIEDLWAIKDDMTTDAANISAITTTAGSIANVNAVAGNATNINAVAGDQTNIDAVAGDLTNIDAVAGDQTNIDAVAGNETNINAVAGNETNINAAVANATNINAAVANETNINTAAANIAAIIDAPNQASSAATSAASAQDWAIKTDGPVEGADYSAKWYALNTDASGKANKDLSNLSAAGETHFADPDLSDLSATGEAHFADPDLANLSAAGNDKFVTKDTAQTISGAKTFDELKTTAVLSAADDSQNVPSTSWIKDYAGVVDYSNLTDVTSSVFASSGIGYKPAVKGLLLIKTRNSVNKSYFWIYNATGTVIFNRLFNSSEGSMDVSGGTATLPLTPDFSIRVGTQAGTAGSDYWAVFYPYKA